MKTWLKGGLIGIVVGIIWLFIGMFIGSNVQSCVSTSERVPPPLCNILIIFYIPVLFLGILGLSDRGMFIGIILTAIIYFVLGAIIGFIIQKTKSKNKM